jgi:hypothetical protein
VKVGIVGSRDFDMDDSNQSSGMKSLIGSLVACMDSKDYVVSGGAPGADTWGEYHARAYNVGRIIHAASWDKYGKRAGHLRNLLIVADADILFVFFTDKKEAYERYKREGRRSGSVDDVELAVKKGIPVYEFDAKTMTWYGSGEAFGVSDEINYQAKLDHIRDRVIQPAARDDEGVIYSTNFSVRPCPVAANDAMTST